jgi:hypothetical protein
MKFFLMALLAFALPLCAVADVTGKWSGSFEFTQDGENHTETAYLILKQDGATLTGSGGPSEDHQMPIRNGKVDGSKLTFEIALDQDRVMSFSFQSDGDNLTGNVSGPDKETGAPRTAKMALKRVAEK